MVRPQKLIKGDHNNTVIKPTTKQTDTNTTQSHNKSIYITRDVFIKLIDSSQ